MGMEIMGMGKRIWEWVYQWCLVCSGIGIGVKIKLIYHFNLNLK